MKFNYQARNKNGEIQTGIVEASSGEAALVLLQSYGLIVTQLEDTRKIPFYARNITLFGGVSRKDVVAFSRQIALMFKSKIPLVQVLYTMAEQTPNSSFREKILVMAQTVEGGSPFSDALALYPGVFSSLYVNIVKSGEVSGSLSESLEYLADHLEREYFIISKIRAAMIYPIAVMIVVIAVLALMVYFVIPQLAEILLEGGQDLPTITIVVIKLAGFFRSWGWLIVLFFVGLLAYFSYFIRTPSGKKARDLIVLRIPLLKGLLKIIYVSRFAENLATLIKGGLAISRALEITGNAIGNESYRKVLFEIRDDVRTGESMSRLLREKPQLFPPMLTQMVLVGEKTGTLVESLMNVVNFYRGEIDRSTDAFLRMLEPILVVFMGAIVGLLVASLFIPLYKIPTM